MENNHSFNLKKWMEKPWFWAAAAAAVYGIAVHSFALNNILHNHDNIASQPGGYGIGAPLGRWFLEILGQVFDKAGLNYNLPTVNGLIYIAILAVTAGFLVSVLDIKSKPSAALIGALFVAFPTVTATMIYRYTVIFYGIGILFAVLAVWVMQRWKRGYLLSVLLIALSMGIYQAYIPVTIALFVLLLIQKGLRREADAKELILQGLLDCAVLIVGLVLYYAGMKLSLLFWKLPLTEYQGIDTMGSISLSQLPRLVWKAFSNVISLPLRDYCGVANRAIMRISYFALGVCSAGMVGYILLKKVKNVLTSLVTCLLCIAFLLAVGFIEVMVPDGWIYTLMVYSYCLLCCAPLVILECLPKKEDPEKKFGKLPKTAVSFLVAVLVFYYGYYANVNYTAVYFAGEQISNYLSNVVVRASMTEGYTPDKQWALLGDIQDPLFGAPWEEEVSYTGLGFTEYLLNQYSRENWIENYVGYEIPMADEQTCAELSRMQEVMEMPCWPSAGSTKVIGDTVIVKFQ